MSRRPGFDGVHSWALGFWLLHAAVVLAGAMWRVVSPSALSDDETGLAPVVAAGSALVLVSWPLRAARWRASARTPASRVRALLASSSLGRVDAVWVEFLGDAAGAHHQRVIWQPWLREVPEPLSVLLHRPAGWLGGAVIDVPGFGTLWPATLLKKREPRFFPLEKWEPPRRPRGRSSTVLVMALAMIVAAAPFTTDLAGFAWLWLWLVSATGSLWLWQSGAPFRW